MNSFAGNYINGKDNNVIAYNSNLSMFNVNETSINVNNGINYIDDMYINQQNKFIKFDKKEIRAIWISTINNLDWPTTKGNSEQQKKELIHILDLCCNLKFNAVILQIRPLSDALYSSKFEPWSSVLTGVQGQDPGYDPLVFAIEEAHKRGLQLHAWINPYRVGPLSMKLSPQSVAVLHPNWVVKFKGVRYLNPGLPEVRKHLVTIVQDIVKRYDVDAIHFDDYFYPAGAKSSRPFLFNDRIAYNKYSKGTSITEWRESNVNKLVREVYEVIKVEKTNVLFGISPSGRRENSMNLYADPFVWMKNQWVDYLAPQIYWEIGHSKADFVELVKFWGANSMGCNIIIGIGAYRYHDPSSPTYRNYEQFSRQIDVVRETENIKGCFFFREKSVEDSSFAVLLREKFVERTIPPVLTVSTSEGVQPPQVDVNGLVINWKPVKGAERYAVYRLNVKDGKGGKVIAQLVNFTAANYFTGLMGETYLVTAVSRQNVESLGSKVVMLTSK